MGWDVADLSGVTAAITDASSSWLHDLPSRLVAFIQLQVRGHTPGGGDQTGFLRRFDHAALDCGGSRVVALLGQGHCKRLAERRALLTAAQQLLSDGYGAVAIAFT